KRSPPAPRANMSARSRSRPRWVQAGRSTWRKSPPPDRTFLTDRGASFLRAGKEAFFFFGKSAKGLSDFAFLREGARIASPKLSEARGRSTFCNFKRKSGAFTGSARTDEGDGTLPGWDAGNLARHRSRYRRQRRVAYPTEKQNMTLEHLPPLLADALGKKGYESLTPVQAQVTQAEAEGRDLVVSAQTGSGKTVAFGLAMAGELLGEAGKLPVA